MTMPTLAINVSDVSTRGIRVLASFIMPGDELYVEVGGSEWRKAVVRLTRDGIAGLHFVRPLSFEQLAIWAITQQDDKLPDVRRGQLVKHQMCRLRYLTVRLVHAVRV